MSAAIRDAWSLDPDVVYLNHGAFGACPREVLVLQSRLHRKLERQPVRFMARELEPALDLARAELASFVGAQAEDLVFVQNATTGINAVLRSQRLHAGDELLTTDHVYSSTRNTLGYVAARSGAKLVTANVPFPLDSPDRAVDAILARVTPRTRLAVLDHVTSSTGLVLPLERVVSALHERDVEVLVDGAHAAGMIPLDIAALGADYYAGNCHKWLCAPKGVGFLVVRPERQIGVRPTVISHGATSTRTDRSRFQLEFGWVGTSDPTAALCVPAALRFMGGLFPGGWPELMRRNRQLALEGRAIVARTLDVLPPCPESMIGALAALPLPDGPREPVGAALQPDPLQQRLLDRFKIEVPVFTWPAAPRRVLRISAQAYNDPAQYALLAQALAE